MRLLLFIYIFSFAIFADDYKKGKKLYIQKACYSCHGINAEGMHTYPRLANRAKGYLSYKLKRFRDKISDNQQQEMMIAFAVSLSDEDINLLTTFFANFIPEKSKEKYDDSVQSWGDGGS